MSSSNSRYGGSEDFTVTHQLRAMDDIIEAIEDINTNGPFSPKVPEPQDQENTNAAMHRYVTALETILTHDGFDGVEGQDEEIHGPRQPYPPNRQPDIAGYSGDKSSYTDAITLGQAYITENS